MQLARLKRRPQPPEAGFHVARVGGAAYYRSTVGSLRSWRGFMKRNLSWVIASVISIAGLGSASAADLAARPYVKAPPAPVAQIYDWTGFYIGINGGGGSAHKCWEDRKSTRLNSSHMSISYAVFCLKKKKTNNYECYIFDVCNI